MNTKTNFIIATTLAATFLAADVAGAAGGRGGGEGGAGGAGGDRPTLAQITQPRQPGTGTPTLTPSQYFKICKQRGGGASTNPDGSYSCTNANGHPVLVPFPIPID
jgi:hypothetical protein